MKLVTRIDGKCGKCDAQLLDTAYTVAIKSTKIVRYVGDKPDELKEENVRTDILCYSCFYKVKSLIDNRDY